MTDSEIRREAYEVMQRARRTIHSRPGYHHLAKMDYHLIHAYYVCMPHNDSYGDLLDTNQSETQP